MNWEKARRQRQGPKPPSNSGGKLHPLSDKHRRFLIARQREMKARALGAMRRG